MRFAFKMCYKMLVSPGALAEAETTGRSSMQVTELIAARNTHIADDGVYIGPHAARPQIYIDVAGYNENDKGAAGVSVETANR